MPSKLNNARLIDGVSWEQRFSITTAKDDLKLVAAFTAENETFVIAVYDGSGITLANFAGLPLGSIIIDTEVFSLHMKIAAEGTSTWKTSTVWT